MMGTFEASYQQFGTDDSEDTPQGMIHIVPECGKAAKWNHIEDLDSFFTRVYKYHQKNGFMCMVLQEVLELFQFIFVVFFSVFLFNCVDYAILFKDKPLPNVTATTKVALSDVIYTKDVCVEHMGVFWWTVIILAVVFWLIRLVRVLLHVFHFWDVKAFFNTALKISDSELENMTWHEVQKRIREVQLEQQMCIHKRELSELDIYHRILRFKNYMVAMVNKSLLPPRFKLPFFGSEIVYLSHGLKTNIEFLLFWGPWSPFVNSWHLKEDYKKVSKRQELASLLSKHILYVALANLLLCPLILLWQILYSFFNYGEILKRQPGALGVRKWSLYGKLYLRHFNELDHELNIRLNRAYRPATKYMNIFTSPTMAVIAKNIVFISGSILAVLLALTVYDEDVLSVEHMLSTITILGAVVASFRAMIPDEHLVWWPEHLMNTVLAHVHYLPASWRGQAHTQTVRSQFSQLFQYTATYLIVELISPIATPLVLIFHLRKKALDLVDFYRCFTVQVAGVGDVCSFAQMDVRTHGNPDWNQMASTTTEDQDNFVSTPPPNLHNQAMEGKTELSLVHFTLTNPNWSPPVECSTFVNGVREQARKRIFHEINPNATMFSDENSLGTVAAGISTLLNMMTTTEPNPQHRGAVSHVMNVSRNEGPIGDAHLFPGGVIRGGLASPSFGASVFPLREGVQEQYEATALDMSMHALYLHEMHHRTVQRRGVPTLGSCSLQIPPGQQGAVQSLYQQERLPLLRSPTHLS
ncbi:autophagy-related protein 9A [Cimex lectularius]|uniref:Autophagy-related protein 9 n=1 Tax=Cimex lectularius TaxID=79782 RepID=A0A8I6SBX8_CIMLE|nr:autophagy-related protein 9A [Cimex lectularius]